MGQGKVTVIGEYWRDVCYTVCLAALVHKFLAYSHWKLVNERRQSNSGVVEIEQ